MSEQKAGNPTRFQPGNKYGKGRRLGSHNFPRPLTREQIMKNIQNIYKIAVKECRWNVALQAMVWQGRMMGMLRTRKLPNITRLSDMSREELEEFSALLLEYDPSLKGDES